MKKLLSIFLAAIASVSSVLAANNSDLMTGSAVTIIPGTGSKGVLTGLLIVLVLIVIWIIIKRMRRK